ncbi:MAG TPA: hypothetical protein VGX24_04810 [Pyrinomonadaceae bacterium]|jgi:hypothetical protein|nr:hypothetical protein [Pyrinomonadaceae bacterium]
MSAEAADTTTTYNAPSSVAQLGGRALVAGVVALVLCVVGAFVNPAGFWRAYLVGYVFWTGVSVGSLAIIMLHHLSGGGWGVVIRRPLEAAARTLPVMAILFLPIAFAVFTHRLYPWTVPEERDLEIIKHKAIYLNVPFFLARAVFYFAMWFMLSYFLSKWSLAQDRADDPRERRRLKDRLQNLSGPGILLFGLTVTFAAVDWVMSLEPEWFSTIYGLLIMVGWGLTSLAFAIVTTVILSKDDRLARVYQPRHFHDHGKLLLAFVMLWAYFSFSQFLIIWSGNLPEEIPWYMRRLFGGWGYVAVALVIGHFALPFVLLLSRERKRRARSLVVVALLVLMMRVVDLFWTIAPSVLAMPHHGGAGEAQGSGGMADVVAYVLNFIMPIAIGGFWLWWYARELASRPLLPLGDEGLENALAEANGHH